MLYAAAGLLQSFAMAVHAGANFPTDADGRRYLNDQHMIFQEMAASPAAMVKRIRIMKTCAKR